MSDKVRAWVWDLDLPPARKLVMLWLAGRATDNGVAFPGEREIRDRTGLGERMVRYHLQGLAEGTADGQSAGPGPLLVRIERRMRAGRNTSNVYILRVPWAEPTAVRRDLEELKHIPAADLDTALARVGVGAMDCPQASSSGGNGVPPVGATDCPEVGAISCREESSLENRHQNMPPSPPGGPQLQQGLTVRATETAPHLAAAEPRNVADARELAEAFYRGLGGDTTTVTAAIRRRDLVIASELVAASATPSEAEAYAVETSAVSGRIAPVDLRSFERERLGWLAQRAGRHRKARGVDRTGQPPSWQIDAPPPTSRPGAPYAPGGDHRETRMPPDLAGNQLGRALRSALLTSH